MADINVEEVLSKLSMTEKCELLAGIDFWHTKALPKHGIPSLRLSDGPNGVRGTRFFNGIPAACFPCGTALGASFDTALLEEAGVKMGEEAKAKGAHCILGPTINMQRSPLGGRGFESIGEDPVLAGLGAAALVRGIQRTGIQATIKHFVCNDQEHRRNAVHSIVSERALREIYAMPFQLVFRDSNPGALMTAYNGVNGTYCSEDPKLLDDLLRKEWGWDGLIMSDWWSTYSTTEATKAGLDLEMPGPTRFRGEALKFNVATDKIWGHELDARVRSMLKFVKACAQSGVPENAHEGTDDSPETAALLRRIGGDSIVLMKNEGDVLPLKKNKKTVVIGPNAKIATYHGGGSASLLSYYSVTPFDGISAKLESKPDFSIGCYSHKLLPLLGYMLTAPTGAPGVRMRVYNEAPETASTREVVDEIVLTKTEMHLVDYYNDKLTSDLWYADVEGSFVAEEDADLEFGVVVCGLAKLYVNGELVVDNATVQRQGSAFFGSSTVEEKGVYKVTKGQKYDIRVEFSSAVSCKLSGDGIVVGGGCLRLGVARVIDAQEEIRRAATLAKDADQVIICAGLNADWETEGNDRSAMDLPAPMDDMIAAVAAANPRTVVVNQSGTPVTMPWINSVAGLVQAWYGGNETGNAIADVLFGDVVPSAKSPLSFPISVKHNPAYLNYRAEFARTVYGEDIYIGYRYYDSVDRQVLFPFGHGLSYTKFTFDNLSVAHKDGKLTVSLDVKNVGAVAGKEVVQVYVLPKEASAVVNRPIKELRGFAKVDLAPGESKRATVEIETKYAAPYFHEPRNQWCVEKGEYEVVAADSSDFAAGKSLRGSFNVDETLYWSGL